MATETRLGRQVRAITLTALLTGSLFPPVAGISIVAPAAAFTLWLIVWEVLRALPKFHRGPGFIALVFAALAAPTLWATQPLGIYGADKTGRLFTLTLLSAAAALLVRDRAGLITFARVWVLAALILAAGALTGVTDATGRSTGFDESNPIWIARALATAVVILGWQLWTRRQHLALVAPQAVVLLAGIYATGSRGPLLGAILGLLAVAATAHGNRGQRLTIIALALAGVVTAVFYLPGAQESRIGGAIADPTGELSGSTRGVFWAQTWDLITRTPQGVGWGNWSTATGLGPARYPHDMWLEVTAEAGWVVGGFLVAVVVLVLYRLIRRARTDPAASLTLGVLACETAAVSVSGDVNARTFFALLTIGWIVTRWPRSPTRAEATDREAVLAA